MAKTKKEAKAAEGAKGKTPAAKPFKVKVEISDIKVEGINEGAMPAVGRRQLQQRKEAHKCWAGKTIVSEHGSEEGKAELSNFLEGYAENEFKTTSEEECTTVQDRKCTVTYR